MKRTTDTKTDTAAKADDVKVDEPKVEEPAPGPFEFNVTEVVGKLLGGGDTEKQVIISVWLSEGRSLVDLMDPKVVTEIKGTAQFKAAMPKSEG